MKKFKRKSDAEKSRALGSLSGVSDVERAVFDEDCSKGCFAEHHKVRRGDWLSEHKEPGQTLLQFSRKYLVGKPHGTFTTLYMFPIGEFDAKVSPDLTLLKEYVERFYQIRVGVMPSVDWREAGIEARKGDDGQIQLIAGTILEYLSKAKTPRDYFAKVGVTMMDITKGEGWNFLFGLASSAEAAGVFSFFRYGPPRLFDALAARFSFDESSVRKDIELSEEEKGVQLRRSCKVLVHEIGHIYGLKHCVYYACRMNGSNHLDEMDSSPMDFCPICLRKIHTAAPMDLLKRYEDLLRFYESDAWMCEEDAKWVRMRLECVAHQAKK
eukprot:TRINITY_DN19332_c0_g1_i1.p1 TRINITY_DN19332_c0_g1~~TRINITY_DN19332_c0_g1_i1.p1  ORF type:complete len:367 (-),score=88.52 TRINITY_DN19332_c0_g1_i1:47-1021(-)